MARSKEFDPDVALERAMAAFWAGGFAGTSTQGLVDALGINRSSLYATFHSKDELYHRALERYSEGASRWPQLDGPGPLKPRLREALLELVEEDLDPQRSRGCFACNAAVERGPSDGRVRRIVGAAFAGVREVVATALAEARERGELAPDADVDALAASLLVTIEGLHVVAKGTRDRPLLETAIDAAIDAL